MDRDFGAYTLHEVRGGGAMGKVYRATQKALGRTVAIKVLRAVDADDESVIARFRREALLGAGLSHEHLVQVLDAGVYDGEHFIAMEYVDGNDLKEWLAKHGPIPIEMALLLMRDISRGIEHAHRHGLVHRDIKPGNIMLRQDGVIKITDFGLARRTDASSVALTLPGAVVGAPAYMSPEQALGEEADQRSDIFSAGVVGYELFGGRRPFPGDTYSAVRESILNYEQQSLGELSPLVPDEVTNVIDQMLVKDRDKRCRTMAIPRNILEMVAEQMKLLVGDKELLREYAKGPDELTTVLRKKRITLHTSLGTNYQKSGREKFKDALREWERVLYLDPSNRDAQRHIEELEKELKKELPRPAPEVARRLDESSVLPPPPPPPLPSPRPKLVVTLIAATAMCAMALVFGLWWINRPATLTITTEPSKVLVHLDGKLLPTTSLNVRKLKKGMHTIRATRDGYLPFVSTISLGAAENSVLPIQLERDASIGSASLSDGGTNGSSTEVATTGTVRIKTSPPKALILVDGAPKAPSGNGTIELSPGTHEIRAEKDGYESASREVTVKAGGFLALQFTLESNGPKSTLRVRSSPEGAAVLVDGHRYSRRTNCEMKDMQPATYLVRLELAGYEPWQKTIALGAARDTTVDAVLRPAQGAKGKLEIRATPYALQFYVDGKEVGTESPLVTVDVDASVNHSVRITHPTCGEKKWDVQVGPGQVRSLAYNFTKDAGSLKISCPKGYGYVLLDGVRTGKDTPYDNDCVPSGTHTVSLYRTDGSYAFEGPSQVEILPGRESRVVFKMIEK